MDGGVRSHPPTLARRHGAALVAGMAPRPCPHLASFSSCCLAAPAQLSRDALLFLFS